ncbi:MAG: tetratricopeptide repeat protein [Nitrospira sp. CG24A]|nr:MAG: tetratricopeptide repeat protein [Nitrospira sp. CG24A]
MNQSSHDTPTCRALLLRLWMVCGLGLGVLLNGCETPAKKPILPPSESDLVLLNSTTLCTSKSAFLKTHPPSSLTPQEWGTGQEFILPADQSPSHGDESYFFDEDGMLVGTVFTFPSGLDLNPYPVLRRTLTQLKPTLEFYLNVANLPSKTSMDSSALYETGDEKTTTQYLVLGPREQPILLQASITIDPYVRLFSPYRREFLERLRYPRGQKPVQQLDSQGAEDKEPFPSLQQFARGQTAQLSYCGTQNYDTAAAAYQKAIATGFANKVWLAEAHHKLGLAWVGTGQHEKAKSEMLQSLAIRPNTPEILNNLGTVYSKLGDKANALASFEKAVTLRPNYAIARYNLAEAYEPTNPRRALSEYETYLALVEGIPDEANRIAQVQQRVKTLKQ